MAAPPIAMPIIKKKPEEEKEDKIDARLLISLPDTHLYKLSDGTKQLKEYGTLELLSSLIDGQEVIFIHCGKYRLALVASLPCLEMCPRNYIFPRRDNSTGIVLSPTIGLDAQSYFQTILQTHTAYRHANTMMSIEELETQRDRVASVGHAVAGGVDSGGKTLAKGIIAGGVALGAAIGKSSEFLKKKLKKNETPTTISDQTKGRIAKAKVVTGAATKVSKALVLAAIATAATLSTHLAAAVKETGIGKNVTENKSERVEAAKDVAVATIGAAVTIYDAMAVAGLALLQNVADATVSVVTHKYGEEAGHTTKQVGGIVTDAAHTVNDIKSAGLKGITKRTLQNTAVEVLATDDAKASSQLAMQNQLHPSLAPTEADARISSVSRTENASAASAAAMIDPVSAMQAIAAVTQATAMLQAPSASASASVPVTTALTSMDPPPPYHP